jgi:hypothetical protein
MAGDQRQFRIGQLSVHDMEVGAADGTGMDADQDLLRSWRGHRDIGQAQRPARRIQDHSVHG